MRYVLRVLVTFCFFSCSRLADSENSVEQHISDVTSKLMPPFQVEGEQPEYMSLRDRMVFYRVPSVSIAIVNNGQIEWSRAFGYAHRKGFIAADTNTVFHVGRLSQLITAVEVLRLAEANKISLDRDINAVAGEVIVSSPYKVTLRQLLSHTSGLAVKEPFARRLTDSLPSFRDWFSTQDWKVQHPPSTFFEYNAGGYSVIQRVIEEVYGQPFKDTISSSLLRKLGMNNSSFQYPLPSHLTRNVAHGNVGSENEVAYESSIFTETASTGLWTTPTDLAKFVIQIQKSRLYGGILNKETVLNMLKKNQPGGWGLGPNLMFENDSLAFMLGGVNAGFAFGLYAFANAPRGVIVLTNSENGGPLIEEILRSISFVYGWDVFPVTTRKRGRLTVAQLKFLEGTYTAGDKDEMVVELKSDGKDLIAVQKWDGGVVRLIPAERNRFFAKDKGLSVEFVIDTINNRVLALTVDNRLRFRKK